jgi:hypothetical protein
VSSRRPHEPESLTLVVTRRPGGGLIIRTPLCPGWAAPATCPAELAQRVEQAWLEAAVAAYARLRGVLYDLAATEEVIPPQAYAAVPTQHPAEEADEVTAARTRRRQRHPATHDPEQWVELPDGGWMSPRGRRYGPQTRVASAVRAKRPL